MTNTNEETRSKRISRTVLDRKFIKSFSGVAGPLYKLIEEEAVCAWPEQCKQALDELKRRLTAAPVLAYPIASGKFTLDRDASEKGIGAVLSQEQNGQERVVAYFSRILNRRERNYCLTRKEFLSVAKAAKSFIVISMTSDSW